MQLGIFKSNTRTLRRLELHLDGGQYPQSVDEARLNVRWFGGGDYTVQHLETRGNGVR